LVDLIVAEEKNLQRQKTYTTNDFPPWAR